MTDSLDQIFVRGKQTLLSSMAHAPDWLMQIASSLINIFALLAVFLTLFALMSVLERKILGRIQNRYGPKLHLSRCFSPHTRNRKSPMSPTTSPLPYLARAMTISIFFRRP